MSVITLTHTSYVSNFFQTGYTHSQCICKFLKYHLLGVPWIALGTANFIKGTPVCTDIFCLPTSYLVTVPLMTKSADEVSMVYMKEILPETSYQKLILQDKGIELKNEHLMSVLDSLGITHIYSNPYYPKGNGRIENVYNFLKCTIAIFTYSSQLELDDALPLATYCFNIAPSFKDLESLFYLEHGRHPVEGRLSNLQNYCRYVGDQPGWLTVQKLRKMWKLHTKLLKEDRKAELEQNKKLTKASNLKIGQLVFVKDHQMGTFDPSYIYNNRVVGILNDSTVDLTTPDGKEKRCNIHQNKPMTPLEASTSVFCQFQDSIRKTPGDKPPASHPYNLHSKASYLQVGPT